jgi:hypothetical protein
VQENFRKSFYGLAHVAAVAGTTLVKVLELLESRQEAPLRQNLFRGAENLIPPDVQKLLSRFVVKFKTTHLSLLFMQASSTRPKDIPLEVLKLKKERLLSWHLENPANSKVHPSRSVFSLSMAIAFSVYFGKG